MAHDSQGGGRHLISLLSYKDNKKKAPTSVRALIWYMSDAYLMLNFVLNTSLALTISTT